MAIVFALGAIVFWSTNAVVAKFALASLAVEQVQFLQFLGATLVFTAIRYGMRNDRRYSSFSWMACLLGVVGLSGTMIFQYIAFSIGPIAEVNILAYAWPLLAAVLIVFAGRSQHPFRLLVLAAMGFIGAALVVGGDTFAAYSVTSSGFGHLAAIASAMCMAVFSFWIGRVRMPAHDVLLLGALFGLLVTGIWCFTADATWHSMSAIMMGLYLGVGPMGIGYLLWSWAMRKDASGNTALLGYLTPISSTILLLSSGEQLGSLAILGAAIVVASCTFIGIQSKNPEHA